MPNYDSTARVPFKHGGSVKKPEVKRIILWKGKAKDWPGAKKAAEQLRNKKAEGGRIGLKHGGKGKGFTSKWITAPGKRRRMDKKPSTGTGRRKINPQWLEEKYNVELKADGGIIGFKHGGQGRPVYKYTKKERSERIISEKIRREKKKRYIKKHGERPPRRKTLAVTDKYKKIRDSLGFKHGGNITVKNEKDSKKAFQIAIEKGLKNPGDHMYMYTKDGKDFFKHIGTRKYDSFKKGGKAKKIIKTIASPLTHIRNLMRAEGQGSVEVFRKKKAEGGIISLKKGGKADKKWIQKATKGMRKDKPCTGKKFGSATCPPGSKRYNLAQTFKKMARSKHASGGLVRYI